MQIRVKSLVVDGKAWVVLQIDDPEVGYYETVIPWQAALDFSTMLIEMAKLTAETEVRLNENVGLDRGSSLHPARLGIPGDDGRIFYN